MAHTDQTNEQPVQEALAPELMELLLELSSGVHRYAMYPPGHPSLENVADAVHERLSRALRTRDAITVAVARDQLLVEGGKSDPKHPVLSDFARRLHDHQLGALSFDKGATLPQVEALLERLSNDVERGFEPIGLLEGRNIPSWAHVRLFPVGYDQLKIRRGRKGAATAQTGAPPANRASELWLTLAQSALATDEIGMADADPLKLAKRLEAEANREFEENVMGHLIQLTEVLQSQPEDDNEEIRQQVASLIEALEPEALQRLIEMGGDFEQRRKFVLDASQSLAIESVLRLLESAAQSSGQNISTLLVRLLKKLARHADESTGEAKAEAQEALKENVEELIDQWNLEDPNPDEYTSVLDAMATSNPVLAGEGRGEEITGPDRVLKMALEVDAWGPTVEGALNEMFGQREIAALLHLVEESDPDNGVARRIDEILTNPRRYRQLITEGILDADAFARLTDRQPEPIEILLEVLAESDSRELRRMVFDQLARLGSAADEAIMRHLDDDRWFVQRNLLVLIQRLDPWPAGFDPEPFLSNPDARVRREAFTLAASSERLRTRALTLGLSDDDERLVQMALQEVRRGAPPAIVPTILNRVVRNEGRPQAIRAEAIKVLRGAPLPMARDALIEVALRGKGFLGRKTIGSRSPELLAALSVLAHSWAQDPKAKKVLVMARKSKDPEIRKAAAPRQGAA